MSELFGAQTNRQTKLLYLDYYVVIFCPLAHAGNDVERIAKVKHENAEACTGKERKFGMFAHKSGKHYHKRMHPEIVCRSRYAPEKREKRTYYSLNISLSVRIIPQFYFHSLDKNKPGDVFDNRHKDGNYGNNKYCAPHVVFDKRIVERTNEIQRQHSRAVQRQTRPCQKAGVNPFFVNAATEYKFDNPACQRAYEKNSCDLYENNHFLNFSAVSISIFSIFLMHFS